MVIRMTTLAALALIYVLATTTTVTLHSAQAFSPAQLYPNSIQRHVGARLGSRSSSSTAISSNEELLPGIKAIDKGNSELFQCLEALGKTPYFRLYSVDILASCEYLPQELFECYTEGCEILPIDEEEVPESIRNVDQEEYDFELDGWGRWDMPTQDYYDLRDNRKVTRATMDPPFGILYMTGFALKDTITVTIIGRRISTRMQVRDVLCDNKHTNADYMERFQPWVCLLHSSYL
jgi:hypothetical protein